MKSRYTYFFLIVMTLQLITACIDKKEKSNHSEIKVTELNTFDHYVKNEELLLGMPVRLKYDDINQHLFIQDLPKWGITEIDDSSNVINEYGRRGRGPGEIQMLNDFFVNKEHLYIVDGGQLFIHKYNRKDGKHISSLD
ncbi:MAG: 6-bladed beta-propeller [Balneolaceae bacterium]